MVIKSLAQLVRDARLLADLVGSFLMEKRIFKKTSGKFWEYETREGIRLRLRSCLWDSAVVMENWWLNEYLRDLTDNREGGWLIDVGAHLGAFSILAVTRCSQKRVLAFEPDPENFSLLKENIRLNRLQKRILPFCLAVTPKSGEKIRFTRHPYNSGMRSALLTYGNKEELDSFLAETICLADVFAKHDLKKCSFLKMDCEGCEYPVLLSLSGDILKKIKRLALEYHPNGDISRIRERLSEADFETKLTRALPQALLSRLVKAPLLMAFQEESGN